MRATAALWSSLWLLAACGSSRAAPPGPSHVGRAVLTRTAKNPIALAVAASGDVYYVERTGEVRRYDAHTGEVTNALVLAVDTSHENGLLSVALDPGFDQNHYAYLYYSLPLEDPLPVAAPPGRNVLARFTAAPDGSLDAASRLELLSVPSERLCCHEAGGLAFGPDGTLFLSVGDNTDPFAASGAAPLDGRPGRETYDARRTAANPFDLRGKILRIEPDGTIPPGNLFPATGELGRPEIYTLGNRNPFRIAIDSENGALYWGEIGPDALEDSALGPRGYDEINRATAPGNFGWPYCIAAQLPYAAHDFATGAVGAPFDCSNTEPSLAAYDYATATYPALGDGYAPDGTLRGRSAMAGAVYRPASGAPYALPDRFVGSLLMTDWTRDVIAAVTTDADGRLANIERLFATEEFHRPIDLEVASDGAVYVLDYGSGFWGDNADAELSRVEYGNLLSPVAAITASATFGAPPLSVDFSGENSRAPGEDDALVAYAWDFDADGRADASGPRVTHVFEEPGNYSVGLVVSSSAGRKSRPVAVSIVVGNSPPSVHIVSPDPNAVLANGSTVSLVGEGHDPEDGDAACDELLWNISLGHNTHSHPITTLSGCHASFVADLGDHADAASTDVLFYAIELVYTDHGGPDGEALLTAREGIRVDAR
jgi:glucose/arabinose dehydrogenase